MPVPPTIWIFEDQLSPELASLAAAPADAPVLLIESDRALRRVPFHKHRIAFLVSAMRHFKAELTAAGRTVAHYPLAPTGYRDSVAALVDHLRNHPSDELWITEPSEWHTRAWIETLPDLLARRLGRPIAIRWFANNLFLTDREEFAEWAGRLKSPVMEHFYRRQRVRYRVLMDGDTPVGGTWNLDKLNRKPAPRNLLIPPPPTFVPDAVTGDVLAEVDRRFPDHPGTTAGFALPVTRADARRALADFIRARLPLFGDYEDAMVTGQPVLFHSFLSPMLNAGLLAPMELISAGEAAFRDGRAPLNAVEGFVRQVLGWREYVYGIYWTFMPTYRDRNALSADRPLPAFYWTGQTDMNCLRQCTTAVIDHAYSHHIQRLMVLGNFATLAGLSPQALNDWFYAMYADAHDWVVTPNVVGMATFADGGVMATKPYVSSGAYINRMSDYCRSCRYDVKQRVGPDACPFNTLYWAFLDRHRKRLGTNPRMTMMLKNLDTLPPAELAAIRQSAGEFVGGLLADERYPS